MPVDPHRKVRSHANIHCAAISIRHDVDPAALLFAIHSMRKRQSGPRVKPGVTTSVSLRFPPMIGHFPTAMKSGSILRMAHTFSRPDPLHEKSPADRVALRSFQGHTPPLARLHIAASKSDTSPLKSDTRPSQGHTPGRKVTLCTPKGDTIANFSLDRVPCVPSCRVSTHAVAALTLRPRQRINCGKGECYV